MTEMIISSLILHSYFDSRVAVEQEILFALGIRHVLEFIP